MALRNTVFADYFYRVVEKLVLPKAGRYLKKPAYYTMTGLVFAALVPIGFCVHPGLGFIFILLSGATDGIDGMVARRTGTSSIYGSFLDSTVDRVADFFYLIGFWILFFKSSYFLIATLLIFISIFLIFMISYIKARAEALAMQCHNGLMERGWRTLYLIGWALLLSIFPAARDVMLWTGLIMLCVLTLGTALQRFLAVSSDLKR